MESKFTFDLPNNTAVAFVFKREETNRCSLLVSFPDFDVHERKTQMTSTTEDKLEEAAVRETAVEGVVDGLIASDGVVRARQTNELDDVSKGTPVTVAKERVKMPAKSAKGVAKDDDSKALVAGSDNGWTNTRLKKKRFAVSYRKYEDSCEEVEPFFSQMENEKRLTYALSDKEGAPTGKKKLKKKKISDDLWDWSK